MSYILEALRKSEQQRQRDMAPRLLAAQPTYEEDTQPAFLLHGLIAAALIGGGVAIGWWQPWQQARLPSAAESTPARSLEPTPRLVMPASLSLPVLPEVSSSSEQEAPAQKSSVAAQPAPKPGSLKQDTLLPARAPAQTPEWPAKTAVAAPRAPAQPVREKPTAPAPLEKASAPIQEKSAEAAAADPAQVQSVVLMAELPLAIRQEIPALSIPVHTYSSAPKERIVGINDRLLQEGEYVAPGLKLEEIAPDSVVFSYKNYRFRRGLQ